MQPDKTRLRRLKMISRLREIEHREAAAKAFAAASEHQRHLGIVNRARGLAESYDRRSDAQIGLDLMGQKFALQQTGDLARNAALQAEHVAAQSETASQLESQSRKRADKVEENYQQLRRQQADTHYSAGEAISAPKSRFWHDS